MICSLYLILTITTVVMFAINITQILTLDQPIGKNQWWLIGFPALVFASFLAGAIGFVIATRRNFGSFQEQSTSKRCRLLHIRRRHKES